MPEPIYDNARFRCVVTGNNRNARAVAQNRRARELLDLMTAGRDGRLVGGTYRTALATIEAVDDGTLTLFGENFTGIDFDTDADIDDVAESLQAGLRANPDAWAAGNFVTGDRRRRGGNNYVCIRDHVGVNMADNANGVPGAAGTTAWRAATDMSAATVAFDDDGARFVLTVPKTVTVTDGGVASAGRGGTDVSAHLALRAEDGAEWEEGRAVVLGAGTVVVYGDYKGVTLANLAVVLNTLKDNRDGYVNVSVDAHQPWEKVS